MIIQTNYKGYCFRSRLEARWAVFFDALNIKWEYEKEGFSFGNNISYLPDFWLPELNIWAEIKPESFSEEEKLKCRLLAKETKKDVLEVVGLPENKEYKLVMYQYFEKDNYDWYGILDYKILSPLIDKKEINYWIDNAIIKSKSARFEFNNA